MVGETVPRRFSAPVLKDVPRIGLNPNNRGPKSPFPARVLVLVQVSGLHTARIHLNHASMSFLR